jgi:hypothetical protein
MEGRGREQQAALRGPRRSQTLKRPPRRDAAGQRRPRKVEPRGARTTLRRGRDEALAPQARQPSQALTSGSSPGWPPLEEFERSEHHISMTKRLVDGCRVPTAVFSRDLFGLQRDCATTPRGV